MLIKLEKRKGKGEAWDEKETREGKIGMSDGKWEMKKEAAGKVAAGGRKKIA
jgi:hypothetical protein